MNVEAKATAHRRRRCSIGLCAGPLLVIAAIVPPITLADQAAASIPESRVARVSLADLDLSNPQGAKVARERLREAAWRLCVQMAESRDVGRQWHLRECIGETTAGALKQIGAPAQLTTQRKRVASAIDN